MKSSWVAAALAAALCASAAAQEAGPRLQIVDHQPNEASRAQVLGMFKASCLYGVKRLGNLGAVGERVSRLERAIIAAYGPAAAGQVLTVDQYDVYENSFEVLNAMVTNVQATQLPLFFDHTGSVSKVHDEILLQPHCTADKMAHGWFDPADLTNNISPFVVEISVQFGGKPYTTRAAYSPPDDWKGAAMWDWKKPRVTEVLEAAMDKANARLIEAMMKDTPTSTAAPEPSPSPSPAPDPAPAQ